MKKYIKPHTTSYIKRCSLIVLALLLTLNSVISVAQPKTTEQVKADTVSQENSQTSMIYLNNSSIEQLVTLKGIGHKKAQAIIAYREQVGAFKSVTELTQVKGIGEKILNDNKARLQI